MDGDGDLDLLLASGGMTRSPGMRITVQRVSPHMPLPLVLMELILFMR